MYPFWYMLGWKRYKKVLTLRANYGEVARVTVTVWSWISQRESAKADFDRAIARFKKDGYV